MKRKLSAAVFFAAAAMLALAASAGAVDGTIEINQAKVLANGGSFPFVIGPSNAGQSYRLTGPLTVSSTTADAIDVNANSVTIDLNGFSITGPGVSSTGNAIYGPSSYGITLENGTVTGFDRGVYIGPYSIVRNVHADNNYYIGIAISDFSVVQGCTANQDGSYGIVATGPADVISGNTVNGNSKPGAGTGILEEGGSGLIIGNTLTYNLTGLDPELAANVGYRENIFANLTTNIAPGGTSLGNNLCSGTVC
jgi:hypothetical protein